MSILGDRIKAARIERGLSQENLANAVGVRKATISRYENGEREPRIEQIKSIAKVLNVSEGYLQGYEEKGTKDVIDAMLRHDAREVERLMNLPAGTIKRFLTREEIDSALDEAKQITLPVEEYVRLERLKTNAIIALMRLNVNESISQQLIESLVLLNSSGQQKAAERIQELTEVPKYLLKPEAGEQDAVDPQGKK